MAVVEGDLFAATVRSDCVIVIVLNVRSLFL